MAMPTIANTMWNARDTAIWERAARRSDMDYKLNGAGEWGVVPDGAVRISAAHRRVPLPTPHAFRDATMRRLLPTLTACGLAASGPHWSTGAPLPEPIQETHAAVLHGKIYIAGGIDRGDRATAAAYRYDP